MKRIAVIGSGYVGTVVAASLAHIGHQVVGVESDDGKLAHLVKGKAPFHEQGLDDLLTAGLHSDRLRFTVGHGLGHGPVGFSCSSAWGHRRGPTGRPT